MKALPSLGRRPLVYAGFAALAALTLLICISMQKDSRLSSSRTVVLEEDQEDDYDDRRGDYDDREDREDREERDGRDDRDDRDSPDIEVVRRDPRYRSCQRQKMLPFFPKRLMMHIISPFLPDDSGRRRPSGAVSATGCHLGRIKRILGCQENEDSLQERQSSLRQG
jgi:hypothetical protein